jgi:hypothetical protein
METRSRVFPNKPHSNTSKIPAHFPTVFDVFFSSNLLKHPVRTKPSNTFYMEKRTFVFPFSLRLKKNSFLCMCGKVLSNSIKPYGRPKRNFGKDRNMGKRICQTLYTPQPTVKYNSRDTIKSMGCLLHVQLNSMSKLYVRQKNQPL